MQVRALPVASARGQPDEEVGPLLLSREQAASLMMHAPALARAGLTPWAGGGPHHAAGAADGDGNASAGAGTGVVELGELGELTTGKMLLADLLDYAVAVLQPRAASASTAARGPPADAADGAGWRRGSSTGPSPTGATALAAGAASWAAAAEAHVPPPPQPALPLPALCALVHALSGQVKELSTSGLNVLTGELYRSLHAAEAGGALPAAAGPAATPAAAAAMLHEAAPGALSVDQQEQQRQQQWEERREQRRRRLLLSVTDLARLLAAGRNLGDANLEGLASRLLLRALSQPAGAHRQAQQQLQQQKAAPGVPHAAATAAAAGTEADVDALLALTALVHEPAGWFGLAPRGTRAAGRRHGGWGRLLPLHQHGVLLTGPR